MKTLIAVTILPLLLFFTLRWVPGWDFPAWNQSWYLRLAYFYLAAFTSFIALIAGLFAGAALGTVRTPRAIFTTLAFWAIAALILLSSISTPTILVPPTNSETLKWSARLSLFLGAAFFTLANLEWRDAIAAQIVRLRRLIWIVSALLFLLFAIFSLSKPEQLAWLNQFDPGIKILLAAFSIATLLWAGYQSWLRYRRNGELLEYRLVITLLFLSNAQISQALGAWGRLSWLLHGVLLLTGLIVALSAFLRTFRTTRHLQPARYFAVLGSIVIVGLSLVSGEMARWLTTDVNRRFIVSLTLGQGLISFIVLYIIVLKLDRLIAERTNALEQEQKLRNELTRLIVHDLKNPIMVMTEGTKMLYREHLGPVSETQKGLLAQIQLSGKSTLRLIQDLLDVERMEAGAFRLETAVIDIAPLLKQAAANLEILSQADDQKLRLRLASPLPMVQGNPEYLTRVFENIIANAIKFTPKGGLIEVQAKIDGDMLVINVADNGPGIPLVAREQIFEKFGQVQGAEKRGAGLGLTFCKMVMEAHGGAIHVDDSHLGGALFAMELPLLDVPTHETETSIPQQLRLAESLKNLI